MSLDWVTTLRQTVPRLRQTVRAGRPEFDLPGIPTITRAFLDRHEIRLVIWDVDGTLTAYHAKRIAPEYREHVEGLFADYSLRHVILSNCGETRFVELGSVFPGITLARAYATPEGPVLRLRKGEEDSHSTEALRVLLQNGARVLRKPSPVPIRLLLAESGMPPSATLMVGDQYLTDVAGANQAGIRSARVPVYRPDTFPLVLRAGQRLERLLVRGAAHENS